MQGWASARRHSADERSTTRRRKSASRSRVKCGMRASGDARARAPLGEQQALVVGLRIGPQLTVSHDSAPRSRSRRAATASRRRRRWDGTRGRRTDLRGGVRRGEMANARAGVVAKAPRKRCSFPRYGWITANGRGVERQVGAAAAVRRDGGRRCELAAWRLAGSRPRANRRRRRSRAGGIGTGAPRPSRRPRPCGTGGAQPFGVKVTAAMRPSATVREGARRHPQAAPPGEPVKASSGAGRAGFDPRGSARKALAPYTKGNG